VLLLTAILLAVFVLPTPWNGIVLVCGLLGETGELVVTNLDARGSVVLRYRTGDILAGGYTTGRCPCCGRTMPGPAGAWPT